MDYFFLNIGYLLRAYIIIFLNVRFIDWYKTRICSVVYSVPVLCFSQTTRTRTVFRTMSFHQILPVPVPVLNFKKTSRTPYHFRTQNLIFTRIPYTFRSCTLVRSTVRIRNPYPYFGVWSTLNFGYLLFARFWKVDFYIFYFHTKNC